MPGMAQEGVNALTRMGRIITALSDLDEERGKLRHKLDRARVRCVHAISMWVPAVPANGRLPCPLTAEIDCRMGFIPGENLAEIPRAGGVHGGRG